MKPNCPKCKHLHILKRGFRKLKTIKKQVYSCVYCKHVFTDSPTRIVRIDDYLKIRIITLYHSFRLPPNKHTKKTTYSTREIARLMNISKSGVWRVIKDGI